MTLNSFSCRENSSRTSKKVTLIFPFLPIYPKEKTEDIVNREVKIVMLHVSREIILLAFLFCVALREGTREKDTI